MFTTTRPGIDEVKMPKLYVSHENGRPVLVSDLPRWRRKQLSKKWRRALPSDMIYVHMHGKTDDLPPAARDYLTTLKMLDLI